MAETRDVPERRLQFRPALLTDQAALRRIMGDEPSAEDLGLAGGNAARARRFRKLVVDSMFSHAGLLQTTVAVEGGEVVGFLQAGAEQGESLSPAFVLGLVRAFGPGLLRFAWRSRARSRVSFPRPEGSYHVAELHMRPDRRGQGIGAALLEEAEASARHRGFARVSLTTTTANPARRLYERAGFSVVETREDDSYRALSGASGRVLMVKELG